MLRPDTQCRCYENEEYKLYLWGMSKYDSKKEMSDVEWCFKILTFLGCKSGFTVNWWKIPKQRILYDGKFPTRAEVNGGWAFPGKGAVWIYREEEWDRVLIHECIHALLWDIHPENGLKKCLESSLNNGTLTNALFEAATELNAEWLWTVIHSPPEDLDCLSWKKQTEWQQNQAYEILARSDKTWQEDTSVFAYYVLKSVLAQDIGDFLIGWLSNTSTGSDWCDKWVSLKDSYYEKAKSSVSNTSTAIMLRMTNPNLDSRENTVSGGYKQTKTRKFKFPRKYSKSYCKKTHCSKMGFTQRASCRPYKNCYN